MSTPPVIVLEFNELCPKLIDRFIAEGQLPGFAKLRSQSLVAVTDAEESGANLEPWIQWVTVHTGLTYAEHGVFDLGDGVKLKAPRLWDMASDAGKKVWICGSMNAAIQGESINGFVLPDPWSVGIEPYPKAELNPFFHLVRSYVQEYTNDKVPLSKLDYARFGAFMIAHGLSPATVAQTLAQLASETGGKNRWKRAMILDRLQWDVFRWYWRTHKPAYSTMFLNSTAHVQHYHWRNFEPGAFAIQPGADEQEEYADAMPAAYRAMDKIVTEVMDMAPEATIVFMTALSQQPLTKYEETGGKQVFRVREPAALMKFAGVTDKFTYAPVMAEEFHLYFETPEAAERAQARLAALHVGGEGAMRVRRDGAELFCGCAIIIPPAAEAVLASRMSNDTAKFHDHFYLLGGLKSGGHHPDGCFWIYRTGAVRMDVRDKVPLKQTAPTLAHLMGLPDAASRFSTPPLPAAVRFMADGLAARVAAE
jgi:hypothetical protein